jgi:4-amino-4-deoxy-L-arabinose transferase-like glycosyltransferase
VEGTSGTAWHDRVDQGLGDVGPPAEGRLTRLRQRVTPLRLTIGLALVAGLAFRVWVYRSALGVPTSDEAVVGLMVRHALDGELTTFYWGQAYGGTQEVLLTVPVFLAFGESWLALRLPSILLAALASLLVWRVGRRTIGEPAAAVAGALFWVWPPYAVYKLTHQNGFYGSDVLYVALLLLLALRLVERPTRGRAALLGLVLGLAFWQTAQIVPIAVPAVAWAIWRRPAWLRHAWIAVLAAILGALPWIVWNLQHGWDSLSVPGGGEISYAERVRAFVAPLLQMAIGLRNTWSQEPLLPWPLTQLAFFALLCGFAYGAYRTRRTNASLLYVVAAAFPFVYALSRLTSIMDEPRYLVVLMPVLALLVAQLARGPASAALILAGAIAVTTVSLERMRTIAEDPTTYPPAIRSLKPLIDRLDALGIDRVYAYYELAYRLGFDTGERIIAVENESARFRTMNGQAIPLAGQAVRQPAYETAVRSAPHAFVFFRENVATSPMVRALERNGYRPYPAGRFVVYALPRGG